jgi:SSS family solute:Na+ symporter
MLAQATGTIGLLDIIVVLAYLLLVAYLGWVGYRGTKTAADYMVAGRKTHPFIMSLSYGATFISTSAIVGFGGVAAMFGMSLLWLTFLNIFVGIFIAFIFLGGPVRRMGHHLDAHTFPEFLGRRYQSRFVQVLAGLIIFLFMPLYAAAVLVGGSEFLATVFNINYDVALLVFALVTAAYVIAGGLKGVMYTDTLQGVIMFVGMGVLLVCGYMSVGGVVQGHTDLSQMAGEVFAGFKKVGHQGWTATPAFGWGEDKYNLWWIVFSTIVMGVGIGVLAQPQLVVRFMTVKSKRQLHRAAVVGGIFILMMTGVAFTVGALSNVYFSKHEKIVGTIISTTEKAMVIAKKERDDPRTEKRIPCKLIHIDTTGDGRADTNVIVEGLGKASAIMPKAEIKDLGDGRVEVMPHATGYTRAVVFDDRPGWGWMFNTDSIIPTFVTSAMPRWFELVFTLTLLAAAMSTLSSQFHTLGTGIGRDVLEQVIARPAQTSSSRSMLTVRIGIVIGLVLAVTISHYLRGGYVVARLTAIFFGLCASTFLPAFIGGLFFKRITRAGAIASMIVGFTVTAFWLLFVKAAEAGAIGLVDRFLPAENTVDACVAAGKDFVPSLLANYPNWPVVDPLLVALPLSALTAIVVSLLTKPPAQEHLTKCFAPSKAD